MKKLICVTLLLAIVSLAFSQQAKEKSALQSMVDTELAFAHMAAEQGIRPSFMAFIADDGILFRPRAVKGKQWMIDHPVPASDQHPMLSWYPAVTEIARAGDMGYTTGPWEYKNDVHDAKPVAFGNFLTVWKKQADGSWKFVIDLGISNPQPEKVIAEWQASPNNHQPAKARQTNVESEQAALRERDRQFSNVSATRDAQTAFNSFATPDVRTLRNEKFPFIGKAAAAVALPASSSVWAWEPAFADVSRSGDLGYTYGTYRISGKDLQAKIIESGNYYRIWKKQNGKWLVVADLTDPVPEE